MRRHFNIAGPCIAGDHYMLPPEDRLRDLRPLIAKKAYFVIHAPRQTGKTTFIQWLAQRLSAEGRSVLNQLAAGYTLRSSTAFPHSLALIGLRDVRDYKIERPNGLGYAGSASPFNIKSWRSTRAGRLAVAMLESGDDGETPGICAS